MDELTFHINFKEKMMAYKNMKIKKNKFLANSDEEVRKQFVIHIGDDNVWFPNFLYSMKDEWINKGFPVSDILIRESKTIMVSPIKTYVPFSSSLIKKDFCPTKSSIQSIVQKFVSIDNLEHGDVIEFSFIVYGLGIFRVSYSSDEHGVGMSIRYLSFSLPRMDSMKYPDFYENFIYDLVSKNTIAVPSGTMSVSGVKGGGLILHVGATGSGKSTSIAAEVGDIAEKITGAINTYESPIEYRYTATLAPVRQYEIGMDIKADDEHSIFDNVKRHLLRNNPSVVVFGEARGNYEIKEVIDASARGHLVFATIHASTVMEALTTLMSVTKDEPKLLENTLHAIIAHKLVTNKEGKIIPIYEILIPDHTMKTSIGKQDLASIAKAFIQKDSTVKNSFTFSDSLKRAAEEGWLTPTEIENIRKGSYNSFK